MSQNLIGDWSKTVSKLHGYLFNFTFKALQSQLPTLANMARWGKSLTAQCPLCGQPQTNKHVLSNCSNTDALARYSNRHDKILDLLVNWFKTKINTEYDIFVDLPNSTFRQCSDLFIGLRPDIVFVGKTKAYVLELTVCHETNLVASRNYKLNKYKDLKDARSELIRNHELCVCTCELSVLGFLNIDSKVLNVFNIVNCDFNLREKLISTVIAESFNIYIRRNN